MTLTGGQIIEKINEAQRVERNAGILKENALKELKKKAEEIGKELKKDLIELQGITPDVTIEVSFFGYSPVITIYNYSFIAYYQDKDMHIDGTDKTNRVSVKLLNTIFEIIKELLEEEGIY